MKKLHMQERAIEEVKLAIKPFYQKRDITKEEYKEILRKAVQKVCNSYEWFSFLLLDSESYAAMKYMTSSESDFPLF